MAINTLAALRAAISDFLNRDDFTAAQIDTFISLAEAGLSRDVRHWRMEKRAAVTMDARHIDLPDDWVETVRLTTGGASLGHRALALMSRDEMEAQRGLYRDVAGPPEYYSLTSGQIEVWPTPGDAYDAELVYRAAIPALTDEAPTNWLLTQAPDAYLYGALVHTAPYLHNDERLPVWSAFYASIVDKLNETSDAAALSGTSLRLRIGAA